MKLICDTFGHIGKPKRVYGYDKTSYKCTCPQRKGSSYDVAVFDEGKPDNLKGICPHCGKKMGYEKVWHRQLTCQACKQTIVF